MRTILPPKAKLVPKQAKRVFQGIIYQVYQWPQKMFDGSYKTFEMLKRPDTVEVLAVKDGRIVILEQEQPGKPLFYDIPSGRHDGDNEDELAAAKRELLEETGMTFRKWKLLAVAQPVSTIERFTYTFLASDFEHQAKQQLDAGEKIKVKLLDFEGLLQLTDNPKARYLPKDILETAGSVEGLLALLAYKGVKP